MAAGALWTQAQRLLPLSPGVALNALEHQGRSRGPLGGGVTSPTLEVGKLRHGAAQSPRVGHTAWE